MNKERDWQYHKQNATKAREIQVKFSYSSNQFFLATWLTGWRRTLLDSALILRFLYKPRRSQKVADTKGKSLARKVNLAYSSTNYLFLTKWIFLYINSQWTVMMSSHVDHVRFKPVSLEKKHDWVLINLW